MQAEKKQNINHRKDDKIEGKENDIISCMKLLGSSIKSGLNKVKQS